MTTSDNIVDFKTAKSKRTEEKFDQITHDTVDNEEFIADFAMSVAEDLVDTLAEFEYDLMDNPECVFDLVMVVESIRSMMHRIRGEEYPMHNFSETMFKSIVDSDADSITPKEFLLKFLEAMKFSS